MTQNLSAQFVCPSSKILDFNEKKASLGDRSPWLKPSVFPFGVPGGIIEEFSYHLQNSDRRSRKLPHIFYFGFSFSQVNIFHTAAIGIL